MKLAVHMGGRRVGTVDASNRRSLRFRYDSDYIQRADATPLSVSMPLRSSAYSNTTVSPYLWGLLPDNERVLARWAREFGCSESDVVGLLRGVGADVAGAAQYVDEDATPEESRPGDIEWITEADVEQFLADVQHDESTWRPQHHEGRWSLAGAQAKIALLHDAGHDRWGIPSGSTPTTHILKPAIAGLDDFDINEHLCVAAARSLGLNASKTSVRTFGRWRVLVVERYDRIHASDGAIVRVHQEDLCQALSVHPDAKYETDGGPGLHEIGAVVRESAKPEDVRRLFNAVAYNWAVLSTDAHAKNYSLLLNGSQVRLAPLYDIATSTPFMNYRKMKVAQKIGGERRAAFVRVRHWDRVADSFGIDREAARHDVLSIIDRVPDAFADAANASEFSADERRIADKIRELVVDWNRVLRASPDLPARSD